MINENGSCYSSLKLQAIYLNRQLSAEIDPLDPIFAQSYRQPLKALLFHLQSLKTAEKILLEFTQFTLHFGSELCDGLKGSWRSSLQPVPIENPIYPPLSNFPVCIGGFTAEWFNFLLEGVSSTGLLSKSTLILKASPSTGLTLLLPGNNPAEIQIGQFTFTPFRCDEGCAVMVSLREFSALVHLSVKLNSKIDFYFGPVGFPFVAELFTSGAFECKFVMATVPAIIDDTISETISNESTAGTSDTDDEYVSATEDESEN